jgi:hypothetical protein
LRVALRTHVARIRRRISCRARSRWRSGERFFPERLPPTGVLAGVAELRARGKMLTVGPPTAAPSALSQNRPNPKTKLCK